MITANSEGSGISVLLRIGNFKFLQPRNFLQSVYINFLNVADFNGDGKPDIIAVGGNTAYMLLGSGDGNFIASGQISIGSEGGFAVFVGSSDFNGDGKLDIVVANRDHSRVEILYGNGDGTFSTTP